MFQNERHTLPSHDSLSFRSSRIRRLLFATSESQNGALLGLMAREVTSRLENDDGVDRGAEVTSLPISGTIVIVLKFRMKYLLLLL
jgi:hypothetical protein